MVREYGRGNLVPRVFWVFFKKAGKNTQKTLGRGWGIEGGGGGRVLEDLETG